MLVKKQISVVAASTVKNIKSQAKNINKCTCNKILEDMPILSWTTFYIITCYVMQKKHYLTCNIIKTNDFFPSATFKKP